VSVITKTIPAVNTKTGKPRYSTRGGAKVRLLVLHTMEGARTVDACGAWFRNPSAPNASSHVGIDDRDTAMYVPYEYSAWTAANANPVSDQAELAAFAKWTAVEWDEHAGMIERTAQWVAERSKARGIPLVRLRGAQTKNGTGVCMHVDITRGWGVGTHTDCGDHFPIDRIIARAKEINQEDDDMTPEDKAQLNRVEAMCWQILRQQGGNYDTATGTVKWEGFPALGIGTQTEALAELVKKES
jgi:hypothetical protein